MIKMLYGISFGIVLCLSSSFLAFSMDLSEDIPAQSAASAAAAAASTSRTYAWQRATPHIQTAPSDIGTLQSSSDIQSTSDLASASHAFNPSEKSSSEETAVVQAVPTAVSFDSVYNHLLLAVKAKDEQQVRLLVQSIEDKDLTKCEKLLQKAIKRVHEPIVRVLHEKGIRLSQETALKMLADLIHRNGYVLTNRDYAHHDADIDRTQAQKLTEYHAQKASLLVFIGTPLDIRLPKSEYRSLENLLPLTLAAAEGATSIVPLLIKAGANVNALDGYDEDKSALSEAILYNAQGTNASLIEILLQAGATYQINNQAGRIAFDAARDDLILCERFIDGQATSDLRTEAANRALLTSSIKIPILKMVLFKGADARNYGGPALTCSASDENIEKAEILLQAGAPINYQTTQRELTPLMYAVKNINRQLVELFLSHNANVTIKESKNRSALFYALRTACSFMLIKKDEKKSTKDIELLQKEPDNEQIERLLMQAGPPALSFEEWDALWWSIAICRNIQRVKQIIATLPREQCAQFFNKCVLEKYETEHTTGYRETDRTLLMDAIMKSDYELIDTLLSFDKDEHELKCINYQHVDKEAHNCLYYAVCADNISAVSKLMAHGVVPTYEMAILAAKKGFYIIAGAICVKLRNGIKLFA